MRKMKAKAPWMAVFASVFAAVFATVTLAAAITLGASVRAETAGFYNESGARVVYELCPRKSFFLFDVCEYVTVSPGSGQSTNGRGGRIRSVRIATINEPPWLYHVYDSDCYIEDFGYVKLIVTGPQSIRLDLYTENDEKRNCPVVRNHAILN